MSETAPGQESADILPPLHPELLRSYRIAHGRATSIEPFERALREITPLTSIKDPEALTEYLTHLNLKGDMVMDELKRVSTEKEDFRKKYDAADKEIAELKEKVASFEAAKPAPEAIGVDANTKIEKEVFGKTGAVFLCGFELGAEMSDFGLELLDLFVLGFDVGLQLGDLVVVGEEVLATLRYRILVFDRLLLGRKDAQY